MIDMIKFKEKVFTDYESPAFALLERVVDEMGKRGADPYYIMGIHVSTAYESWFDICPQEKYLSVNTVSRHNGTAANVTVEIAANIKTGRSSARRICVVKVPKDASDKVINKRIDKILEAMQTA